MPEVLPVIECSNELSWTPLKMLRNSNAVHFFSNHSAHRQSSVVKAGSGRAVPLHSTQIAVVFANPFWAFDEFSITISSVLSPATNPSSILNPSHFA